jgi:hypothetical protein
MAERRGGGKEEKANKQVANGNWQNYAGGSGFWP